MGPDVMIFVFWMLSFKPAFSLSSFTLAKLVTDISYVTGRVREATVLPKLSEKLQNFS